MTSNHYKIVDRFDADSAHFFTVELAPEMFVDVKFIPVTGLVYVMENGDGSTVYSNGDKRYDTTWPDFEYDEAAVINLVKEAEKKPILSDIIKSAELRSDSVADTSRIPVNVPEI